MYVYDIKMSPMDKNVKLDSPEWVNAMIEAKNIANQSFSAIRYKRGISKMDFVDSSTVVVRLESRDPINPTRSLSSFSIALVKNEEAKQSHLLDGHIISGRVFKTSLVSEDTSQITDLSDTGIVQEIISVFFSKKDLSIKEKELVREVRAKIRDIVIAYVNDRNEL